MDFSQILVSKKIWTINTTHFCKLKVEKVVDDEVTWWFYRTHTHTHSLNMSFCVHSGISTRKRSSRDTLGLELFKGSRGKNKLSVSSTQFLFVCNLTSSSLFSLTDLVKEIDIFTAAPGWPVLKTAGLALAAQVSEVFFNAINDRV